MTVPLVFTPELKQRLAEQALHAPKFCRICGWVEYAEELCMICLEIHEWSRVIGSSVDLLHRSRQPMSPPDSKEDV